MESKKILLLILDGYGWRERNITNPFRFVDTPNFDFLKNNFPFCLLGASGLAQGLPSGEPGNCEMGHLTIGTGQIYYQNLTKIDLAIESGEFFQKPELLYLFEHSQRFNSKVHFIGLISQNKNISSLEHLKALLKLVKEKKASRVYLHLFTDGLDSQPKSALYLIKELKEHLKKENIPAKIATLCGRFFALDQTKNYLLRTQLAFSLIVEGKGKNLSFTELENYLKEKYYDPQFNDSLLEPIILEKEGIIENNDALLFFNYEGKTIAQLFEAFVLTDFSYFPRAPRENIYLTTLTRYLDLDYPVVFEDQKILINLSRILAENNLSQLKIVDKSREKLFRYYFNGFIEEEHPREYYKILPPFSLDSFEKMMEMTKQFLDLLIISIQEKDYDFILANLPLFDIVGHSGNLQLATKVISSLDSLIKDFALSVLEKNYSLIITSDHGNIEKMISSQKGEKDTQHNPNPVPFYLIDKNYQRPKDKREIGFFEKRNLGILVDISATILDLFHLPQPSEFQGKSLLRYFQ